MVAGPLSNLHRAVGPFPTLEVTRLTAPAAVAGLSTRQPGRTTTLPREKIREKIPGGHSGQRGSRPVTPHRPSPQRTARKARHRAPSANSGHTPGFTYGSEGWGFESLRARWRLAGRRRSGSSRHATGHRPKSPTPSGRRCLPSELTAREGWNVFVDPCMTSPLISVSGRSRSPTPMYRSTSKGSGRRWQHPRNGPSTDGRLQSQHR